jgi:hypothetical protein
LTYSDILHPNNNVGSQHYDLMPYRLGRRVTNPNSTPILMNSVVGYPVNKEVSTAIRSRAASEGGLDGLAVGGRHQPY